MRATIVIALLLGLAAPAFAHPPAYRPSARDVAGMRAAIRVADGLKGGPCAERFGFQPEFEARGYVLGTSTCVGTDPAWVILKRAGKGWKVVVLGTGLTGRELRGMGVPDAIARRFE